MFKFVLGHFQQPKSLLAAVSTGIFAAPVGDFEVRLDIISASILQT